MNEKVAKALSYVDEKYVSAAAKKKKKKAKSKKPSATPVAEDTAAAAKQTPAKSPKKPKKSSLPKISLQTTVIKAKQPIFCKLEEKLCIGN